MRALALLVSDLHFSHVAPAARSAEPDWYAAQRRYIKQLRELQMLYGGHLMAGCPIVIAGDVFDRWSSVNSPAELVNFLLHELPDNCIGIPGQHDLPEHRYDAVTRSPYWTLVSAGAIRNLAPNNPVKIKNLVLHGFPWGYELAPLSCEKESGEIHLAVIHAYIWNKDVGGYPGAPVEQTVEAYNEKLVGYDAAVFGDNHTSLLSGKIINPGSFMRRKSDERNHRPMVGILYEDGSLGAHYLDVSADLWLDDALSKSEEDQAADTSGVIESLKKLGADALDFRATLRCLMDRQGTSDRVRGVVDSVLG